MGSCPLPLLVPFLRCSRRHLLTPALSHPFNSYFSPTGEGKRKEKTKTKPPNRIPEIAAFSSLGPPYLAFVTAQTSDTRLSIFTLLHPADFQSLPRLLAPPSPFHLRHLSGLLRLQTRSVQKIKLNRRMQSSDGFFFRI